MQPPPPWFKLEKAHAAPDHMADLVKDTLKKSKTEMAIIPGRLAKILKRFDISKSLDSNLRSLGEEFMIKSYLDFRENGKLIKTASYAQLLIILLEMDGRKGTNIYGESVPIYDNEETSEIENNTDYDAFNTNDRVYEYL
ncbi:hypothetical protein RF11_00316 [Thelohanellus kitauei]|uniref:Uncharacterized protein n=1 Tax=Thelohanellus kitauei TaxID=669202 RepID=A0A0C2MJR4_THEKT|nr:hypothetical protein RF11_00316 [Thelohanellus kitauei]